MRHGRNRGAALAETALVASAVMLLMLGTIRLATVGFLQVSADAGAYYDAHQLALSDPTNPTDQAAAGTYTTSLLPSALGQNTAIAPSTPAPAPTQDLSAIGSTIASYNFNNNEQRHGGFSFVMGTQVKSSVTRTMTGGLLGGSGPTDITLTGTSIEPYFEEFCTHFCDGGLAPTDPNIFQNGQKIFTDGENSPPYMIAVHTMLTCDAYFNNGAYNAANNLSQAAATGDTWLNDTGSAAQPGVCTNGLLTFHALGLAEYLQYENYNTTGHTAGQNGISTSGAFAYMDCHQRVYAHIANALYPYNTISYATGSEPYPPSGSTSYVPNALAYPSNSKLAWILSPPASSPRTAEAEGNVDPFTGTTVTPQTWGNPDLAQVYSWDYALKSLDDKGPAPLNPGNGC